MLKITTFSLVLLSLMALAIGAAIGYFWKKHTDGTWKEDFKIADKENKSLAKQVKKGEKNVNNLKKKNEGLKGKIETLESTQSEKIDALNQRLAALQEKVNTSDEKYAELKKSEQDYKTTNLRVTTELDRLKNAHAKLNEKYKHDTSSLKEWNKDREIYNRQLKDLKSKLQKSEEKAAKLGAKADKLEKDIEEYKAFGSKLRSLKAKNAKYSEDLKYWEKKHYDTHHELAALKEKVDGIVERNQELEMTNQSARQSNDQMLQKVQEFKAKFVDINNKYHKLVENRKN